MKLHHTTTHIKVTCELPVDLVSDLYLAAELEQVPSAKIIAEATQSKCADLIKDNFAKMEANVAKARAKYPHYFAEIDEARAKQTKRNRLANIIERSSDAL